MPLWHRTKKKFQILEWDRFELMLRLIRHLVKFLIHVQVKNSQINRACHHCKGSRNKETFKSLYWISSQLLEVRLDKPLRQSEETVDLYPSILRMFHVKIVNYYLCFKTQHTNLASKKHFVFNVLSKIVISLSTTIQFHVAIGHPGIWILVPSRNKILNWIWNILKCP